jgi:hypothetical protein
VGQVERGHVGRMVEHRPQLGREQLDLVVAQGQAGQPGHVDHVVPAQGHRVGCG